jgi:hypothetical protein
VRPLRVYGTCNGTLAAFYVYFDSLNPAATRDLIGQAQWGLDVKAKVLPVYEKIFDVEFPLPKLDTLVVSAKLRKD